jgi:hypothetical protein
MLMVLEFVMRHHIQSGYERPTEKDNTLRHGSLRCAWPRQDRCEQMVFGFKGMLAEPLD